MESWNSTPATFSGISSLLRKPKSSIAQRFSRRRGKPCPLTSVNRRIGKNRSTTRLRSFRTIIGRGSSMNDRERLTPSASVRTRGSLAPVITGRRVGLVRLEADPSDTWFGDETGLGLRCLADWPP